MKQILSAVLYLHEHGICHRDLKPENFMLSSTRPDAVLKLIDFGLSQNFQPLSQAIDLSENTQNLKSIVGTALYMAPEVLTGKGYNYKCDNWSLGIILYILLSGMPPFTGNNNQEIYEKVLKG